MKHSSEFPDKALLSFRRDLLAWFTQNGRSFTWRTDHRGKYRMILAEFLLQRTRAETVESAYAQLLRAFPNWRSLADASPAQIAGVLKPLGLWRRRSQTLSLLSKTIAARRGRFPRCRSELEKLPGIGQYLANVIEVIYWNRHRPFLDVNIARVIERYFRPRKLADIRYDPYLQELAGRLTDCEECLQLNWAILDFAAKVCTLQKPKCRTCTLASSCNFARRINSSACHRVAVTEK